MPALLKKALLQIYKQLFKNIRLSQPGIELKYQAVLSIIMIFSHGRNKVKLKRIINMSNKTN